MKITIESTRQIEGFNGIDCRIWRGRTESGIEVELMVPCVRARRDQPQAELERELREINADRQLVYFDTRLIT